MSSLIAYSTLVRFLTGLLEHFMRRINANYFSIKTHCQRVREPSGTTAQIEDCIYRSVLNMRSDRIHPKCDYFGTMIAADALLPYHFR